MPPLSRPLAAALLAPPSHPHTVNTHGLVFQRRLGTHSPKRLEQAGTGVQGPLGARIKVEKGHCRG